MLKETIKEIMKNHFICSDDEAREALEFVRDLIDAEIEHTKKTEPYATKFMSEMREANYHIGNLLDNLE